MSNVSDTFAPVFDVASSPASSASAGGELHFLSFSLHRNIVLQLEMQKRLPGCGKTETLVILVLMCCAVVSQSIKWLQSDRFNISTTFQVCLMYVVM